MPAWIPSVLERSDASWDDGKRTGGMCLGPWSGDMRVLWDATCIDKLTSSNASHVLTGVRLEIQKLRRGVDTGAWCRNSYFSICVEKLGSWAPRQSPSFAYSIRKRVAGNTVDRCVTSFLRQRIANAIQRANGASVLAILPHFWVPV